MLTKNYNYQVGDIWHPLQSAAVEGVPGTAIMKIIVIWMITGEVMKNLLKIFGCHTGIG